MGTTMVLASLISIALVFWQQREITIILAVLAEIFRGLYNRVGHGERYIQGAMIFLQIWAYEHIPVVRPMKGKITAADARGLAHNENDAKPLRLMRTACSLMTLRSLIGA
ncbi:hypothetical protein AMTR_s00146p00023670 [Amborella trichopoda]|uniref:Aminotransferase-like plant mobile domain-containing protein n=1 Tax=Amborella trichopoda TaxID=13333 RepID=W1P4M0_AMBTC|nr:hypothetical protein AMTR_s00146p00023670 [Amborella trichopoda]